MSHAGRRRGEQSLTGFESQGDEDLDSGMGLKVCVERGERRGGIYEPCSLKRVQGRE